MTIKKQTLRVRNSFTTFPKLDNFTLAKRLQWVSGEIPKLVYENTKLPVKSTIEPPEGAESDYDDRSSIIPINE